MPAAVLLLAWPLIEIALFVTLGGWLGLWITLAIVLGTAVAGIALMRWRGMRAVGDLRREIRMMGNPLPAVADQAMFMIAGLLLILPGFLTDIIGLLLLIPPIRMLLVALAARRMTFRAAPNPARARDDVLDGDYTPIDDHRPPGNRPSGWTQD